MIRLRRGGRLVVGVETLEAPVPCRGCTVIAVHRAGIADWTPLAPAVLQTDAAGIATSELLPPGRYWVTVREATARGVGVEVRSGARSRETEILPGRDAEILFESEPRAFEVRLWPPPAPGVTLSAMIGGQTIQGEARGAGVFLLPGRPDQTATLRLSSGRFSLWLGDFSMEDPGIDIELSSTLLTASLMPLPASVVSIRSATSGRVVATVPPGHHLAVPDLPPGAYDVMLGHRILASAHLGPKQSLDLGLLETMDSGS